MSNASHDTTAPPLVLDRQDTDAASLIVASGEIDVATSPLLRDALNEAIATSPATITLDFTQVAFIDSSGLGVLVGALERLRAAGADATIRVLGPQDAIRKVFAITGLDRVFELSS